MNTLLQTIKRFTAMWYCAYIVSSGCFKTIWKTRHGKTKRRYVTKKLHLGGVQVLKSVKADCDIFYDDTYASIDPSIPKVFMSNHLSLFDLPLITAHINENIRVVIKKELIKVPILGRAALRSEQLIVDRNAKENHEAFYKTAKEKLQSGIALWFFPEGTRSETGKLLPFKPGGFKLAMAINAQIIPVGILGTNAILPKGKLMPHLNQSISLKIGEPIFAKDYSNEPLTTLMDKVFREINKLCMDKEI